MKENSLSVNAMIANERLDKHPMLTQMVVEQLGERLIERLFREIEKGEKIVCLKDVKTNDNYPLNMTEFKQEIIITDLVRCKDCKYNDHDYCNEVMDGCRVRGDWFCAGGERREE